MKLWLGDDRWIRLPFVDWLRVMFDRAPAALHLLRTGQPPNKWPRMCARCSWERTDHGPGGIATAAGCEQFE
jgi:hypothetical protein